MGLESSVALDDQVLEFGVDVFDQVPLERVEIDIAGAHDRRRVLVFHKGEQEMFERRVFLLPLVGEGQGLMQGLFKASRE